MYMSKAWTATNPVHRMQGKAKHTPKVLRALVGYGELDMGFGNDPWSCAHLPATQQHCIVPLLKIKGVP